MVFLDKAKTGGSLFFDHDTKQVLLVKGGAVILRDHWRVVIASNPRILDLMVAKWLIIDR